MRNDNYHHLRLRMPAEDRDREAADKGTMESGERATLSGLQAARAGKRFRIRRGYKGGRAAVKNVLSTLEAQRKAMGLTYKALAIKAGLKPDTVRGILQGWQSPKIETLRILADALDVELGVTAMVGNR